MCFVGGKNQLRYWFFFFCAILWAANVKDLSEQPTDQPTHDYKLKFDKVNAKFLFLPTDYDDDRRW